MNNPLAYRLGSRTRRSAPWPLSLLSLICCTNELATQSPSALERQVTTDAVTRVSDAGTGAAAVLDGFLRFHNTGTTTVKVVVNSCPFQFAAYRTESRVGAPAWSQTPVCTLQPIGVLLRPGASDSVSSSVSFREILGDSLPEGRYYFALRTTYKVLPDPRPSGPTELPKPYVFSGGDAILHR
jgi:hypothetical protein